MNPRLLLCYCAIALMVTSFSSFAYSFYAFYPSATTDGIDPAFDRLHEAYLNPAKTPRNKLVLFLPGTGVAPNVYKYFPETAANNGFHVLNLDYINSFAFIGMSVTNNCDDCYFETRMEILTGNNLSPVETVDRNNSIEHRLIKALEHLAKLAPADNWDQYLSGTNILWHKFVVAGHSQGGGQAGFIAKQYRVDRAIMFDSGDWYDIESRPATWITTPGATPDNRFFGAAHTNDPLFPNPHQIPAWTGFGLAAIGPVVFAENETDPQFDCSRMIRTSVEPRNNTGSTAYHGAMVRDLHVPLDQLGRPVFARLWEFMLFGRITCPATFDGDTIHDLTVYHPPSGIWKLLQSVDGFDEIQFGARDMVPLEADFNGDSILDLTVYDKSTGVWHIDDSGAGYRTVQFGGATSIPVPADFDGDNKADLAVFEPSNGTWYILQSRDGFRVEQFGNRNMRPALGDFDGDQKTDLAVFESSKAKWHVMKSRDGFTSLTLGRRGSWPVPGDYDGDGHTDLGSFHPASSTWYLQKSLEGPMTVKFGYPGVVPVNRDYDGDGRDDIGVYDPIKATWFLEQSRDGHRKETFGQRFAIPLGTPIRGRLPVRGLWWY